MQHFENKEEEAEFFKLWQELSIPSRKKKDVDEEENDAEVDVEVEEENEDEKEKKNFSIVSFRIEKFNKEIGITLKNEILNAVENDPRYAHLKDRRKVVDFHRSATMSFYKRIAILESGKVKTGGFFQASTAEQGDSMKNNSIYQLKYAIKFLSPMDQSQEYVWCFCVSFSFTILPSKHWKLEKKNDHHLLLLSSTDIPRRVLTSYRYNNNYYINTHYDADIRKHSKFHF